MAFGPIMKFKVGDLNIEMSPLTKDVMPEFIEHANGGGLQSHTINRYISKGNGPTLEDELDWYEKVRLAKDSYIWGIWVVDGDNKLLIGNSALIKVGGVGSNVLIRQGETGSLIFRQDYWGKGIASAAHKARTWFAFQELGLHRLKSAVIAPNKGSLKALYRSGYQYWHTEKNGHYGQGRFLDVVVLENVNPIDLFWNQWWSNGEPDAESLESRRKALEAISWAEANVER